MIGLFIGQLIIPALLVAWVIVRPARGVAALGLQVTAATTTLAALARYGVWLFPPWWFPYLAAAAVVLSAVGQAGRGKHSPPARDRSRVRLGTAFSLLLLAASGSALALALRAAQAPPGSAAELSFPMERGRYLIVNGGTLETLNAHRASMDPARTELQPWRGNGHAVDIVAMDRWGRRAHGVLPADPTAYVGFGVGVLAPCAGTVLVAMDGLPDQHVPQWDRDHPAGNHVLLDCGDEVHVLLGHLREGSVLVHTGDRVEVAQPVGAVGNSGGTSEPHLHIHAQRPGPPGRPIGGDPVPMRIAGRYLVRGDRMTVE